MPRSAHGFELVEQQYVAEYDSHALLYRHTRTGAQLMSVICSDENKTFGATFRTPVGDSKGTPHILEHSVLCGSRKYPIKEPFVELMKGSLNTFLNAFTYPDRTCYPVASTNLQDFYNLVDVYLDAVLHPRCVNDPSIFAQVLLPGQAGRGGGVCVCGWGVGGWGGAWGCLRTSGLLSALRVMGPCLRCV
jgi:Zn-dependent M16 (insulinase) family peptidase